MTIDRRQEIIDAAAQSFARFGYKATTMDQVAKQAHVGKGTIYTFFKNKEELFYEIIKKLMHDMESAARHAIDPEKPFQNNVHQALYKMLEFRMDHQLTIKLVQEQRDIGTPVVRHVMQTLEESTLSFIKNKVEKAVEQGEIKSCNPDIVFIKNIRCPHF